MSLSLPLMNNLCKRWILPTPIRQACDYYFLRNLEDSQFVQLLQPSEDGNELFIQEHGIQFQVIFMYDAASVYVRNGELAARNEPNNTKYWCSFRSIQFDFQGVSCVKSYVLVQVDKGAKTKDLIDSNFTRVAERPVVIGAKTSLAKLAPSETVFFSASKNWKSHAENSLKKEED